MDYTRITECVALVSTSVISPYAHLELSSSVAFGSGFFIGPQLMVTCEHLVRGVDKVYFKANSLSVAFVMARREDLDLALLRPLSSFKSYLELRSRPVEVGEEVYAVGFPLGIIDKGGFPSPTFTKGIVSRVGVRPKGSKIRVELIQFDAAVNPGNSGGPLLDGEGKVVGVVCAGIPSAQNMGFAIPSIHVKKLLESHLKVIGLRSSREEGGEGVEKGARSLLKCIVLESRTAKKFGLDVDHKVALITELNEELRGRLEVGDVVLEVDDEEPFGGEEQIVEALLRGGRIKVYRRGRVEFVNAKP